MKRDFSFPQQELLVYLEAEMVIVSPGIPKLSLFWAESNELIPLLQDSCAIDEGAAWDGVLRRIVELLGVGVHSYDYLSEQR